MNKIALVGDIHLDPRCEKSIIKEHVIQGQLDFFDFMISDLKSKNISFVSITDGMDTTTASGELFFHIFGALAQFERSLIQERVKAGLEAAKNRGIRGGRPRAISEEKMIAIKKALNDGMSKASICRTFEVKRSTLIDSLNRENI